jgi:outer membrane protein assembly factor BamB
MGASGVVCCLNRETGAVHWQHDFKDEFEVPYPEFGAAASPLVVEFQVIVPVGGPSGGNLVALEIGSGKPAWSLKDDGPSYSSPMLVHYGKNSSMIVTQTQRTFTGVSLEGKRLWELPFETPYLQNIITTTLSSSGIITGGTKRPLEEFTVGGTATPKPRWENADHSIYMNSPVIFDGMVIGVSERDKGHLFAVDASSGKTLWKTMQRMGENVEVLVCDGYLVLMADSGKLSFAKVSRTGAEVLQSYTVSDEPVTTHPILDHGWIYVKDRVNLIAFRWE